MKLLEEYAQQANSCREAAEKARNAGEKEHLLEMALRWEELARQRAAHLHLEDMLASILNARNGNHHGGAAAA